MNCPRCRKEFANSAPACPHCGEKNGAISGVFQTSTVLISTDGTDRVYRSVEEVPAHLRSRLLKTTNGANSATILIADRKGRKEIDKAMRKVPGPSQRRLMHTALAAAETRIDPLGWLTPARRKWLGAIVALIALAIAVLVFLYHGKI